MKNEHERRCGVCDKRYFERNNYFYGKLMTVRDFFAEQCYFNEKRWLINRMVLGWGVICGLDVVAVDDDPTSVKVKPGLAIDCCGREILICEEKVVPLVPEKSACQKTEPTQNGRTLAVCLVYHECKTEPLPLPPIACDQKERGEFNRIRDSFVIKVIDFPEQPHQKQYPCPQEDESISLHEYVCQQLKNCPECPDSHCIVLATLNIDNDGKRLGKIDTCSRRRFVYNNALLYDLISCVHHNYIGTWLVLGPIFNEKHHKAGDGPAAGKFISTGEIEINNVKINLDINAGNTNISPRHGEVISYKNTVLDIAANYTWKIRNFIGMDWMNIHDIEDNIHQHLPGNFADPFNPEDEDNFAGKHHALVYFLVYIQSPEERKTRLFVRSDDAVRVWLNGEEISELRYLDDRDIKDFSEGSASITLNGGYNILMVAVAETNFEWGFSARIEHDGGLRFTPIRPE